MFTKLFPKYMFLHVFLSDKHDDYVIRCVERVNLFWYKWRFAESTLSDAEQRLFIELETEERQKKIAADTPKPRVLQVWRS